MNQMQTAMGSVQLKRGWKAYLLLALGLIAFVVYIYLFRVDLQQIAVTVQQLDVPLYALAACFAVLNVFFFALSWRSLLHFLMVKLSVVKSFLYCWYGIFVDAIVPAESISGEVSRLYLVTREDNTVSGKVVASLIVQRIIGMGVNIGSLILGIVALSTLGQISGTVLNVTVFLVFAVSAFIALLALLCVKEKWTLGIVNGFMRIAEFITRGRFKLAKFKDEVVQAARMFHDSIREFKRGPKSIFASTGFNVASWAIDMIVVYLVFLSVRYYQIHWSVVVLTISIIVAIKSVPIGIPFEAGLPEIAMSSLFIWLGVPELTAFTVTILSRLLTMWLRFFIGFGVQQWLEIGQVKAATKGAKTSVPVPEKA